jgi:hypothetical protein
MRQLDGGSMEKVAIELKSERRTGPAGLLAA